MYLIKTGAYCWTHFVTFFSLLDTWDVKHCGVWISTATLYCYL
jgi:hypothetical protein